MMKIIITTKPAPRKITNVNDVTVVEREEDDIEKMSLSQVVDFMSDLNGRAVDVLRITPAAVKAVREGRKVEALWKRFFKEVPPNEEIRKIAKEMLVHVERAEEFCEDYQWEDIVRTARKMP